MLGAGAGKKAVKTFLASKGLVATDQLLEMISSHSPIDKTAATEEEGDLIDWSELDQLPLPSIAKMDTWSRILRVPEDSLSAEAVWNGEIAQFPGTGCLSS